MGTYQWFIILTDYTILLIITIQSIGRDFFEKGVIYFRDTWICNSPEHGQLYFCTYVQSLISLLYTRWVMNRSSWYYN